MYLIHVVEMNVKFYDSFLIIDYKIFNKKINFIEIYLYMTYLNNLWANIIMERILPMFKIGVNKFYSKTTYLDHPKNSTNWLNLKIIFHLPI